MPRPDKTKAQFVSELRKLADVLEAMGDAEPFNISKTLYISAFSKDGLLAELKRYGGVWDKCLSLGGEDIHLVSREMPITLCIQRDKLCRKTVTYECEPMFSPDDEKEIDAARLAANA